MCLQKDYSWNPSTCISENSKYLKSIADTSVITCDENLSVMDVVSTKMTYYSNKCVYFAQSFIRGHITVDNYYYLLSLCKT